MMVYIHAYYVGEWEQVCHYVEQSPHVCKSVQEDFRNHSTVSIRRSNGRLCADFVPEPDFENHALDFFGTLSPPESLPPINPSLEATSQEAAAIKSLTLLGYYGICWLPLSRPQSGSVSSAATISSGAVFLLPPKDQPEEGAEIASLAKAEFADSDWALAKRRRSGMSMENGWTRFNAKDVCNDTLTYTLEFTPEVYAWLTQANHIFSRLQITTNLEDYLLLHSVDFKILIGSATQTPGYLFLCPEEDFRARPTSFRWPNCPAYWSLDSSGAERLSREEAIQLGCPYFQLTTQVHGWSWDTNVYAGLRQFHQAKGFDLDSQDIARHLGYPLFRLSGDASPPFSHGESVISVKHFVSL
ncbi:hypothetical protein C8F04DRAFT_456536 [Mycena alexandri]|uniref:Uncharacterized protein n=1 Tax=Mycena alexandri TaxID=1745969 RepID=A0AAD6X504_9AGAR|nr:hypothetical protein C8F04DRAFT_456536 [Mycena alexandri]